MTNAGVKTIGLNLATIALAGSGVGIGSVFGALLLALARNPGEHDGLLKYAIFKLEKSKSLFSPLGNPNARLAFFLGSTMVVSSSSVEFYSVLWSMILAICFIIVVSPIFIRKAFERISKVIRFQILSYLSGIMFGSPKIRYEQLTFNPKFLDDPYADYGSPDLFFFQICSLVSAIEKGEYTPTETCSRFFKGLSVHLKSELETRGVVVRTIPLYHHGLDKRSLKAPSELPPLTIFELHRLLVVCYEYEIISFFSVVARRL
jgi:hypothetical protein